MAIDRAAFIADMNIAIPDKRDPRAEGADQIQAVKRVVQASFPNVDDVVNATASRMNEIFDNPNQRFLSEVTMFAGDVNSIPDGWVLCDGNDGDSVNGITIPDLRDKFIKGWSASEVVGTTGGEHVPDLAAKLTVNNHTLTVSQIPSHSHGFAWYHEPYQQIDRGGNGGRGVRITPETKNTNNAGGGGGHNHGLSNNSGNRFNNQPAYYTLAFLIYVGNVA
ncbi:hypothetical protein NVP1262O_20 [Vibrio phage 1.262.O._10N.286.51.A9]|nr:hypothetical protein NVP1262O_20 [Vibrio phage 1.262.O._10N.286.51.A9]